MTLCSATNKIDSTILKPIRLIFITFQHITSEDLNLSMNSKWEKSLQEKIIFKFNKIVKANSLAILKSWNKTYTILSK